MDVCTKKLYVKTLMKLTAGVIYINIILRVFLLCKSALHSFSLVMFGSRIFGAKCLCEKHVHKTLVKLTPAWTLVIGELIFHPALPLPETAIPYSNVWIRRHLQKVISWGVIQIIRDIRGPEGGGRIDKASLKKVSYFIWIEAYSAVFNEIQPAGHFFSFKWPSNQFVFGPLPYTPVFLNLFWFAALFLSFLTMWHFTSKYQSTSDIGAPL